MCGISGYFAKHSSPTKSALEALYREGSKRGSDGFGWVTVNGGTYIDHKKYKGSPDFDTVMRDIESLEIGDCWISNSRAAPETESEVNEDKLEETVQPIILTNVGLSLVHNGAVSNKIDKELRDIYTFKTDIDSEAICWAYIKCGRNMKDAMEFLSGGFAFLMIDHIKNKLYAVCSHNPLYTGYVKGHGLFFSSTEAGVFSTVSELKGTTIERNTVNIWEDYYAHRLPEYTIQEIDLESGMVNQYEFEPRYITNTYDCYRKEVFDKPVVLVAASGGLDSSVTLATLKSAGMEPIAVHFSYGHRGENAEYHAINRITKILNVPMYHFNISEQMKILDKGMLTDKKATIVTGTEDGLKTTAAWTVYRNHLMLTYMGALAESLIMQHNYKTVYLTGGFMQLSESGCIMDCSDNKVLMFDNKESNPSDIKVGDELLSFNFETKKLEKTTVQKVFKTKHQKYYKLNLIYDSGSVHGKKTIIVSGEHPIFIKNKGWVNTENIVVGDILYSYKECEVTNRMNGCKFIGRKIAARTKEWNDNISKSLKGRSHSDEHRKNQSNSLIRNESAKGSKNPMFGHIRSQSVECWCGKTHPGNPEKIRATMLLKAQDKNWIQKISDGVRASYSGENGDFIRSKISAGIIKANKKRKDKGIPHTNQTAEGRERCRRTTLRLISEGRINPSICFNNAPNKQEITLIDLFEKNSIPLRFVGDGQIWITSEGKHLNPDFINLENRKIVEFYGGLGFFHSLEEIDDRDRKYKNKGWEHLAILETEMNDLEKVKEKVYNFMFDVHNGWLVDSIDVIDEETDMLNYHCEPNNNFFVNKILTHNSYPDNSERFIDAAIKFFKFSITGTRLKPLYGMCNILKTEQYILLDKLGLLEKLSPWLISCDRPVTHEIRIEDHERMVGDDEFVYAGKNCSKDGKPACGSGLLSYWACKMAGVKDLRRYYEVNDPDYVAYEPNSTLSVKNFDMTSIINRIEIPIEYKNNLFNKLVFQAK